MNSPQPPRRSLLHRYFAFVERRSPFDRLVFHTVVAVFVGSIIFGAISLSQSLSITTPLQDSSMHEGVVGTPRFVNPVLAITRPDHDMVALLYKGVLGHTADGSLTPTLAESVELAPDNVTYSITLRDNLFFHDGTPITADDVVFTYLLIQNPELKSPLRGNWEGAVITKTGERSLTVQLTEPYAPFRENFTVGIMPAHIWSEQPTEQIPFSQYNTSPVGSGDYMVDDISFSDTGLITQYRLSPSPYAVTEPSISQVVVSFYSNEAAVLEALKAGSISSTPSLNNETSIPEAVADNFTTYALPLPRTFALFYNQNRSPALRELAVRQAISAAIDRNALVTTVLNGYGIPTNTPVPAGFDALQSTSTPVTNSSSTVASTTPSDILRASGWTQNDEGNWTTEIDDQVVTLALTIQTVNTPSFVATSEFIQSELAATGIPVTIEQYEQSDLVQNVIRPRNFTVLLFGNDVGRGIDLYPFWHSSQREDPGLNITGYTNIDTDALLTTLRTSNKQNERAVALQSFLTIINAEQPATFLYTPSVKYVVANDITVRIPEEISSPSERFTTITDWYRGNESLWPFFLD